MHSLSERAGEIADKITDASNIHIVTHIDADGITAGSIASETLKRLKKKYTLECVKQLDEQILTRLNNEKHELVWFTDLGSSIILDNPKLNMIVTDHHSCSKKTNVSFHLNPHLFDIDGTYEISGAGTTYLVSKAVDGKNMDLSALAIVGAVGDIQDKNYGKLTGLNRKLLNDGKQAKVLQTKIDIRYFGRETRPISKLLQFASDPIIPGLSGRENACTSFLKELDIRLKTGDSWRTWSDLEKEERKIIISAIAQKLLNAGFGYKLTQRLIGEVYILSAEQRNTELRDAKEYATLLNSTARYGQYEVGLKVCLGDRDEYFKKALNLLRGHRHNLVEGLQVAREENIHRRKHLQYFHAKDGIRDTIVGIVTNMLLNSEDVDSSLPLIGFAHTEKGDVKVSARGTQELIDRGLDLSKALRNTVKEFNGVGGGHKIAAGATIPMGKEEEFLDLLEEEIGDQLPV